MRAFAVVFATLLGSASAIKLKAEPESDEHHFFNRRDSTDRQLAELNEQIHAAEEDFVKDLQSQKPASFLQVDSEPQSEEHHYFNKRDATDRQLAEIDDEIHAAEDNFVKDLQSQKPASFLQVDSEPQSEEHHYFNRRDATDRELAEINDEIHAAEENFVQDVSKPTSFLQLNAEPEQSPDPSAAWEADDAKEMALEATPHDVAYVNGMSVQAPETEADIEEEKDLVSLKEDGRSHFRLDTLPPLPSDTSDSVSLKEKAEPKEDKKEEKAAEIKYDKKKFAKDFGSEWKNGDYPSYKKTYSKDAFPGRKAVVAAEDSQSDGKPSKGLRGANVGAYLKHEADGTITR